MAKCGRKPVLDQIKKSEILGVGCSRRTAAKYVGCAVSTIQNTATRDHEFAKDLYRAEQNAELGFMRNIQSAAKKTQYWRAAAWALERINPRDFAQRKPNTITVEQVRQLLTQFAEIVIEEVPVSKYRTRIIARLNAMAIGLGHPIITKVANHVS